MGRDSNSFGSLFDGMSDLEKKVALHRLDGRALYLIECGFRTSIIQVETGLPAGRIRDLFHGASRLAGLSLKPPSGTLQESESIIRGHAANAEGTLFLLLYRQLAGEDNARRYINIDAVIKAHRLLTNHRARFGGTFTNQPRDINKCWVLARDYRVPHQDLPAALQIRRCLDCGAPYLEALGRTYQPNCPFCSSPPRTAATTFSAGAAANPHDRRIASPESPSEVSPLPAGSDAIGG